MMIHAPHAASGLPSFVAASAPSTVIIVGRALQLEGSNVSPGVFIKNLMEGQSASMKQQIYTQPYQIEDAVDKRLCLASSDYPSFPRDP